MKRIEWLGSSRADVRAFPDDVRIDAGWQLELLQRGEDPQDWKPMATIGPGVLEIRIRDVSGAYCIIYLAVLEDRVVVIHAFQKKTAQTAKKDLDLAVERLRRWKTQR